MNGLTQIDGLSAAQRESLISRWNDTDVDHPDDKMLHQLFEAQVAKTPDEIALIFGQTQLTYAQVNRRANQMAHAIRKQYQQATGQAFAADTLVGLYFDRRLEMVITILAIYKAGGAYVPMSSDFPAARLEYVVKDSQTRLLITEQKYQDTVEQLVIATNSQAKVLVADEPDAFISYSTTNLTVINSATDLCYVIYTSGTTGDPKGVMLTHQSVVNRICWGQRVYPLSRGDKILQKTPYIFDVSVTELLWANLVGATIVIAPPKAHQDPALLDQLVRDQDINIIHFVPSMLSSYCQHLSQIGSKIPPSIQRIFCSGEALTAVHVKEFNQVRLADTQLHNTYGPTEASIECTYYDSQTFTANNVPIGRAIDNVRTLIVDENLELVADGVEGELCIAGAALARGYLNLPELTAKAFVDNPYATKIDLEKGFTRMYRTGDLVCRLANGNLEYRGRNDSQVKIQGHRIELSGIEAVLSEHPQVRQVVVIDLSRPDQSKYLAAYIVPTAEQLPDHQQLSAWVEAKLPKYMVPVAYVAMDSIPVTVNGKLDRKALPEPEFESQQQYVAPRNELESLLCDMYQMMLGKEQVGVNDNFLQIGGNSLLAMMLSTHIQDVMSRAVTVRQVLENPTVARLAECLQHSQVRSLGLELTKLEPQAHRALTIQESSMYAFQNINPDSTANNLGGAYWFDSNIDSQKLLAAINAVVANHSALRSSFILSNDEVVKHIANVATQDQHFEFQYQPQVLDEIDFDALFSDFCRPFDLAADPLLRCRLHKTADLKRPFVFLVDMHHIISDGVSLDIFISQLCQSYNGEVLQPGYFDDNDYANALIEQRRTGALQRSKAYWQNCYHHINPALNLPTDFVRPTEQSQRGRTINLPFTPQLTQQLYDQCARLNVTPFVWAMSVFNILLAKYSEQDDIIVGSSEAGRHHSGVDNLVGLFVNTIALRTQPQNDKTFAQYLDEVRITCLEAVEHADHPIEEAFAASEQRRDLSRNPLFDVLFIMLDETLDGLKFGDAKLNRFSGLTFEGCDQVDLSVKFAKAGEQLGLQLVYNPDLFVAATIERLSEHYRQLLISSLSCQSTTIAQMKWLTDAEQTQLLREFNHTTFDYEASTIHGQITLRAALQPNKTALVYKDQSLSYAQLIQRIDNLAFQLRAKGVKPNTFVALMMERSISLVITLVAIMKAGGAYVPINTQFPAKRVEFVIKDTQASLLLCDNETYGLVRDLSTEFSQIIPDVVNVDNLDVSQPYGLEDVNRSRDLAYVIYTSGTTGMPKGVAIEHRSVLNLRQYFERELMTSGPAPYISFAPHTFDASAAEIFIPLMVGRSLHILPGEVINDIDAYVDYMNRYQVEFLSMPPSYLAHLPVGKIKSLKVVLTAGEKARIDDINRWVEQVTYVNAYGPTETTVLSTASQINQAIGADDLLSIGKPMYNTQVYILGQQQQLLPVGVPGEIYIGGDCLARGYLNNPQLNDKSFIDNPFKPGEKIYRSGDIGKWTMAGDIAFVGRCDNQVKIRGFRIELDDIDRAAMSAEQVEQVHVAVRKDSKDEDYLCLYYVAAKALDSNQMRSHLANELPQYMMPTHFKQLAEFPLTVNGKIDDKALPSADEVSIEHKEANTPLQQHLVEIWQRVLGTDKVGINGRFIDYGGQSLKAIQAVGLIKQQCAVTLGIKDIFVAENIEQLARMIEQNYTQGKIEAQDTGLKLADFANQPVQVEQAYDLSHLQLSQWLEHQFHPDSPEYNVYGLSKISGVLDVSILTQALEQMISRHSLLRTRFAAVGAGAKQFIESKVELPFEVIDEIPEVEDLETWLLEQVKEDTKQAFDLTTAPLFKIKLFHCSEGENYLYLNFHHIIFDGWSERVFYTDLFKIYKHIQTSQAQLPALSLAYSHYAQWQQQRLQDGGGLRQFWVDKLAHPLPELELPVDGERPLHNTTEGDHISLQLEPQLIAQIRRLCQSENVSLYGFFMTTYMCFLQRLFQQQDIIIGTTTSGRSEPQLEPLIGFFTNTMAIRCDMDPSCTFAQLLQRVSDNIYQALEYSEYPFMEVIKAVNPPRTNNQMPLTPAYFVWEDFATEDRAGDFSVEPVAGLSNETATAELEFTGSETANGIELRFVYKRQLFNQQTISRWLQQYLKTVKTVVSNSQICLADIDMITPADVQLYEALNDTHRSYTQQQMFTERVFDLNPDNENDLAVGYKDQSYSYKQLDQHSNQVARLLRQHGAKPNHLVGVFIDRGIAFMPAIFGILKSGAAYVPIDPSYPAQRIKAIMSQCQFEIVLTEAENMPLLEANQPVDHPLNLVVCLDACTSEQKAHPAFGEVKDSKDIAEVDPSDCGIVHQHSDLAYVIFTSGSTGLPKGVEVSHENICNISWVNENFGMGSEARGLQFAPLCFDVSVGEIFPIMAAGGQVHILPAERRQSPQMFIDTVAELEITWITMPPGYFYLINELAEANKDKLKSLRAVFLGGEPLLLSQVQQWHKVFGDQNRLYNVYGPTETTVLSTFYHVDQNVDDFREVVVLGKPINNTQVFIVDQQQRLCPAGIAGEIIIGGEGVTRGYLNDDDKTAQVYIDNTDPQIPLKRYYKSGDLGRLLTDGNLEFLGRKDAQVKIRGFRVELGEIESVLSMHPQINEIAVVAFEDVHGKSLAAYFTAEPTPDIAELRGMISGRLPEYMMPSYFIPIEQLPLTSNLKIDRKQLAQRDPRENAMTISEFVAPQTEMEQTIAQIWQQTLQLERVGLEDNFFEIGGSSLTAMGFVNQMNEQTGLLCQMSDVFAFQTVRGLAAQYEKIKAGDVTIQMSRAAALEKVVATISEFDGVVDVRLIEASTDHTNAGRLLFGAVILADCALCEVEQQFAMACFQAGVPAIYIPAYSQVVSTDKAFSAEQSFAERFLAHQVKVIDEQLHQRIGDFEQQVNAQTFKTQLSKVYRPSPWQNLTLMAHGTEHGNQNYFNVSINHPISQQQIDDIVRQLVARHPVFHSVIGFDQHFTMEEYAFTQEQAKQFNVLYLDLSEIEHQRQQDRIAQLIEHISIPFELTEQFSRIALIKEHHSSYRFIWVTSHFVADGECGKLMHREFNAVYQAVINGAPLNLPDADSYQTYVEHLRSLRDLNGERDQAELAKINEWLDITDQGKREMTKHHSDTRANYFNTLLWDRDVDTLPPMLDGDSSADMVAILYAAFSYAGCQWLGLSKMPIANTLHGRLLDGVNYFNTFGDFHDRALWMVDLGDENDPDRDEYVISEVNKHFGRAHHEDVNHFNLVEGVIEQGLVNNELYLNSLVDLPFHANYTNYNKEEVHAPKAWQPLRFLQTYTYNVPEGIYDGKVGLLVRKYSNLIDSVEVTGFHLDKQAFEQFIELFKQQLTRLCQKYRKTG